MAEDVRCESLNILWGHVVATFEEGRGFCGKCQIDGATGGGAATNQKLEVRGQRTRLAGGVNEGDDVVANLFVHVDGVHDLTAGDDFFDVDDGIDIQLWRGGGHGIEHSAFFLGSRVIDTDLEQEAVELSFWESVSSFLVDGVLGGKDEEGVGQLVGVLANGDLAFLHRLQQGALNFGWSAVDFVCEDKVGENGAEAGGEGAVFGVIDHGADDIGGEEVWSELNALESRLNGRGEGAHGECFGQTGDAFQEDVAIGQESDEEAVNQMVLADEDAPDFGSKGLHPRGCGSDGVEIWDGGGWGGRGSGHRVKVRILGAGEGIVDDGMKHDWSKEETAVEGGLVRPTSI